MGEGFESLFFGLGAVSPPALTPRVNKGRSVGATAGIPRRKEKKNFLPPFCLASSLKIISYTLMDHFELKKKEEIKSTKERKRTSHFS